MREGIKAAIVTDSTSYEPRAEYVGEYLASHGCQVTWVESDFNHREKKKRTIAKENHLYIHSVPYKKNLSFRRFYYHWDFSRKAYACLKKGEMGSFVCSDSGKFSGQDGCQIEGTSRQGRGTGCD